MEVISSTSGQLTELVSELGTAGMERSPAPGKWNTRLILCHLADVELVFALRLRQSVAEPHHAIQPFDQDTWAKNYSAYDPLMALAVFCTTRKWNLAFLETVSASDHGKMLTHPERGTMTFRALLETIAGHDLNHLSQIETIAGKG